MATRSIKPRRDDTLLSDWESMPERAPSVERSDAGGAGSFLLFVGFFLTLVGALALVAPLMGWGYFVRPGLGYLSLTVGLAMILAHCYLDPEQQLRRLYGTGSVVLILAAAAIRVWPFQGGTGFYFLPVGVPL